MNGDLITISADTSATARPTRFLKAAAASPPALTIGFDWAGRRGAARCAARRQPVRAQRLPAHRRRQQRDGDCQACRDGPGRLHRHRHDRRRGARRRLGAGARRKRAGRRQALRQSRCSARSRAPAAARPWPIRGCSCARPAPRRARCCSPPRRQNGTCRRARLTVERASSAAPSKRRRPSASSPARRPSCRCRTT